MNRISKEIKGLIISSLMLTGLFFSSTAFAGFFGGHITDVKECTCGEGSQVTIFGFGRNAKFKGTYLYLPSTRLMGKSRVISSRNIIGSYFSGGSCSVEEGNSCTSLPISKGTMKTVGTN